MNPAPSRPARLVDRLPALPLVDPGRALELFLDHQREQGFELYAAQEEAILELYAGQHVILNTPTGSGKTLVGSALQWKALCERRRCFYTSPIKALVSEKFFALCRELGAENVGMLTGDASVNPQAPIVCCTAEILANMALRQGAQAPVDYVVMDEFHYFGDRDRGVAWQLPLLCLPHVVFLCMSATLGNVEELERKLVSVTGKKVAVVRSAHRPVPLEFEYRETPIQETLIDLAHNGKVPVYVVSFSQREAAELAQDLTSLNFCSKEEKQVIAKATDAVRFDSPYGKDLKRFVRHGVGLHHAGLLPKYRLLVEKLAQDGLLKVISGTDTLGVGVNVPIRTVLFTKLAKFDGEKVRLLTVRDFKQIAGRAGRKGFDVEGTVVCQAPEHVTANLKIAAKEASDPKKYRKLPRKKPPERDYVPWDRATFERLQASEPEELVSRFRITHDMILSVLDREVAHGRRDGGYRRIVEIIDRSFDHRGRKTRHRRDAARQFRELRAASIVEVVAVPWSKGPAVRIHAGLQRDFSLHQSLSLFLVDALTLLDPEDEAYANKVLSFVEAIVEDPRPVLERQRDEEKRRLLEELKRDGVEYEERMERLSEVTHPQPDRELIEQAFYAFRLTRPFVPEDGLRPKSVARAMFEEYAGFGSYVTRLGLERSEGLVLRYLTDVYKVLVQTVPAKHRTAELEDAIAYLRATLDKVDASLVREWEALVAASDDATTDGAPAGPKFDRPRAIARLRAELHALVRALSAKDYEAAAGLLAAPSFEEGEGERAPTAWGPAELEAVLQGFYEEHRAIVFDHRARLREFQHVEEEGEGRFYARQILVDDADENLWVLEVRADLGPQTSTEGAFLVLERVGT